uniref:Integrase, catalytic region, zinc finger, CCHC-type, peptidase aspartic, catalytic n=1 Tax=Tanacetum cinerariifolium TaxID=118510 RepID=A0A6L2KBP3_TANCI|nr:integrase, catalytic region, zinc finger, CCHC-type, peptidase aspartic, catalytic [Tanacetum cinerariifolium]
MEQAAILREIVEQAKSLNPLDSASYSACKYVKLIQESLGYVKDTCPDIHKPSEKLVAIMPINKKKIVTFTEPVISSSTSQKQLGSSQTQAKQATNNYVLTSTGVKMIQVRLNAPVKNIRTDNETEFVNQTLHSYYESFCISHETSVARSPQQNGVVERRNRTLLKSLEQFPVANAPRAIDLADSPMSKLIDQDAPSTCISSTQEQEHSPTNSQGFEESPKMPHFHDDPLYESLHDDSTS